MNSKILLFLFFCFIIQKIQAQNAMVVSGGTATGSGGNVSYSVGQIAYQSAIGSNGSVLQGVQQPFEISTLGADNFPSIMLTMSAYPNPTVNNVTLKIADLSSENLNYQIIDVTGKLIEESKITNQETQIQFEKFTTAIYLLNIIQDNKTIKTFKIIKN